MTEHTCYRCIYVRLKGLAIICNEGHSIDVSFCKHKKTEAGTDFVVLGEKEEKE